MKCFEVHQKLNTPCDEQECRQWIKYKEDCNCVLIAVEKNNNKGMTLREIADRIGVSFVRIKQIEDKVLQKLKKTKIDE
jgi:Mg-chelatase subunit ChlD